MLADKYAPVRHGVRHHLTGLLPQTVHNSSRSVHGLAIVRGVLVVLNGVVYVVTECLIIDPVSYTHLTLPTICSV